MNTVPSIRVAGVPGQELLRAVSSTRAPKLTWRQRQQERIAAEAVAVWNVLRPYPSTLVWPLVVLAVLLLAGVWGVTHVAQATADSTKDRVSALATDVATWYRQSIVESYAPVISMSVVIRQDPTFSRVYTLFNNSAPELMALAPPGALRSLQLAPNGVIQMVYPGQGNDLALGVDLFEEPLLTGTLDTIRNGGLTLMGPLTFIQGGFGVRARLPVFIRDVDENVTWGSPRNLSSQCGSLCYNATARTKFWGFSTALIELQKLHNSNGSRLRAMDLSGYHYELLAPNWLSHEAASDPANMTVVARSDRLPCDPVEVDVNLPYTKWILRVSPNEGWSPSWYPPLLVCIIILAIAVSVLMFAMLVSRRQHQTLLEALLPREMIDDLKNYNTKWRLGPRVTDTAGATTADVLLNLLGELLEGITPDLRDIVLIRQQILQNMDIYSPLNLCSQLRDANLGDDVTKALMHQLGGRYSFSVSGPDSDVEDITEGGEVRAGAVLHKSLTLGQHDYATVAGALAMILVPQGGWYDSGPDMSDAASDAALPTHNTEVAISPGPSNANMFGRAASHLVRQNSWRCGSPEQMQATPPPPPPLGRQASCTVASSGGGGGGSNGGVGGCGSSGASGVSGGALSAAGAVGEGGPAIVLMTPGKVIPADLSMDQLAAATSSAVSSANIRVTDDGAGTGPPGTTASGGAVGSGGGAAAAAGGSTAAAAVGRRPPRKGDSHTSLIGLGRTAGRRKSSMLSVSIADGPDGAAGGGGGSVVGMGKTLSSGSHPDAVTLLHGGHPETHLNGIGNGRLWAATVSRRSITGLNGATVISAVLAKKPPTPPAPVIEEVERVLATADSWQFDTWRLRDVTNGHPLSALGFYLIHRAGLITSLKLKPSVLARLLRHIEAGYPDNPYHNATHAADVLQTLHVIIHGAQLHVHYLDHLGLLAAYFAAIVHDYGHPGLTNDFLVATSDPLAVRYNDRSPLENHHAAAAFSSMRRPGLDVLSPLTSEQKSNFRRQVIEMVLSTDMKQHFSLLSHFSTVHRLASYTNKSVGTPTAGVGGGAHGASSADCQANIELPAVSLAAPSLVDMAPKPLDETERLLSLQMVIKAADLGHLGEELDVHKRWLNSLEEEFFRQGDKERQLGIPISPLFDRAKQGVSKSQVGFYDFVALPMVHALCSVFPGTQPLMTCFLGNYNHYTTDPPAALSESRSFKQQAQQQGRQAAAQVV
ncbi:hypothetical protein PLESTB_001004600 [Pleodorina starrii]|uniref:Phosphodiesterase n=1 Tax=Pleodorina starrii TaxID=330485 RepID=A0A9W6BP86_9CHLO|nr:hypothetical protein PLESTM_001202800 [Pleodorina starrii]GLC55593.1 hypothetical protein PLESTB_001004600 [Pleodorina starrii]GLC65345.1 hypothetical protein PLESTF_000283200 [Pleodorina starrii]